MEKRKISPSPTKPSPLPLDFLKMVTEVFRTHFDAGLKLYNDLKPHSQFEARGEIHTDEVVLAISLMTDQELAATTVYASVDFDAKAEKPTIQELLGYCIDAAGSVFGNLLSPERPEVIARVASQSLSALDEVPFNWTVVETNSKKVFVKLDKSNLTLDSLADEWLLKNDPTAWQRAEEEHRETEKLFVTGKPRK